MYYKIKIKKLIMNKLDDLKLLNNDNLRSLNLKIN